MLFRSDRKSTRLNSSHTIISYAVFCLKKKKKRPEHGSRRTRGSRTAVTRGAPAGAPRPRAPPVLFRPLRALRLPDRPRSFFFNRRGPPRHHPFPPPRRPPV